MTPFPFPMLLGVCMTLVDAERDMWLYNADTNADAMAISLELHAICEGDDVCNGAPLHCTLIATYPIESPMCWDHGDDIGCMDTQFVEVPVVDIECSNVINCSLFALSQKDAGLSFEYIPDPSDCCRVIPNDT